MTLDSRHISEADRVGNPLVSVIMPVYNSEAYVEDALKSLLDQDFASFEVIAVDDGSTDDSGKICDRLAEEDPRLRVIHKENGGICSARNTGLDRSRGEYLMFCDNDDRVLPGFIADNYALAKRYDADMVRFGRILVHLNEEGSALSTSDLSPADEMVFSGDEVLSNLEMIFSLSSSVWGALYRKEFIDSHGIRFDEEVYAGVEDRLFNDHVYRYVRRIVLNPQAYYVWLRRYGHSTSFGFNDNSVLGFQKCFAIENQLMRDSDIDLSQSAFFAHYMVHPLTDMISSRAIGTRRSYLKERRTFKLFRALYAPYFEQLKTMNLSVRARRSLWLLKKRFYLLFYLYGYFTDRRIRGNIEG